MGRKTLVFVNIRRKREKYEIQCHERSCKTSVVDERRKGVED